MKRRQRPHSSKTGLNGPPARLVAYKDRGDWYFSPPDGWYWTQIPMTAPLFSVDHGDDVQIPANALTPLQITDVHLFNRPNYPSERDITFSVTNVSAKKVRWFQIRLSLGEDNSEYGENVDLEPGASSKHTATFNKFLYLCEGAEKPNLVVDEISFTDGSEWRSATQTSSR